MCDEKIKETTPKLVRDYCDNTLLPMLRDMINHEVSAIWNDAVSRLVGVITREINTVVQIAFSNGVQILNDQKTVTRISNEICQALIREINSIQPIKIK